MRIRRPQGNPAVLAVLAVLRSPAHRLLSGMVIELRYTGRRSGRPYVLPVQYARAGDRLVVVPQAADAKMWWRNFLTEQPVTVRLAGSCTMGARGWSPVMTLVGRRIAGCTDHDGGGWRIG